MSNETSPFLPSRPAPGRGRESGAVTIMVALAMLVFLTLVAVGMSRNAFREAIISGTARQGVMASNVADSGIEWALYWMNPNNEPPSSNASAQLFAGPNSGLIPTLLANQTMMGQYYNLDQSVYSAPVTPPSDLTVQGTASSVTSGFNVAVMRMGKEEPTGTVQGTGFNPATGTTPSAPNLWAIRSDGQVTTNGVTFNRSSEAWISTPISFQ